MRATWSVCLLLVIAGCNEKVIDSKTPIAEVVTVTDDDLRKRLDDSVDFALNERPLDANVNAAWQVVHGIMVFGRDFKIIKDKESVSALDYLLGGGKLTGWNMLKGDHGLEAVLEEGTKTGQGHPDQWLGYLSLCGMQRGDKIVVAGQDYTVNDLLTQAQWDIYEGMEATWTLMAFSNYLALDEKWQAKDGTEWSIDRIARMESAAEADQKKWEEFINNTACGGSHRMYGLTIARNRVRDEKGKLEGVWKTVDGRIADIVKKSREYQQPDGSFSTNFFARPGSSTDIELRINRTGHIFEFLMVALDDEQLKAPWVTSAALHLLEMFENTKEYNLECGSLYHAIHGLKLYRDRRFGPREPKVTTAAS